eukprot:IDg12554t1
MDAALAAKFKPSFLRIQGNTSVAIPITNARYSFLWLKGPLSTSQEDYTSTFISKAVSNGDVKRLIRDLYLHLSPQPEITRQIYRDLAGSVRAQLPTDVQQDSAETEPTNVLIQLYQGEAVGEIQVQPGTIQGASSYRGPSEDFTGYTVPPSGLFQEEASVVQIVGQTETTETTPGRTPVVKMKKLKPSNKEAIKGAFPLLYLYGDSKVSFDIASYLTAKNEVNPPAGVDV